MKSSELEQAVLDSTPLVLPPGTRILSLVLMGLGAAGFSAGFVAGRPAESWTALLVGTVLLIGLAVVGIVFSAIFQVTRARWGRAYRRLAEGSLALMPPALLFLLLFLAGGGPYLPWAHAEHLSGGKHIWLSRPFWDARVLLCLGLTYALALVFLYYSLRRDFCLPAVSGRLQGPLSRWLARDIPEPAGESERCSRRLAALAPLLCIAYAVCFTLLGFDLIMALEPQWISALFGAWYFMGHLFSGLALLILVASAKQDQYRLGAFFSAARQKDLATLLFAFGLVNIDFFWSQYLTIWYGNLPEETEYIITRTLSAEQPWPHIAWLALTFFFIIPFAALLFRKIKQNRALLGAVCLLVIGGIFLARFVEIAPALLPQPPGAGTAALIPVLLSSGSVLLAGLGAGLWLYNWFLTQVPVLPVGDEIFRSELAGGGEAHS